MTFYLWMNQGGEGCDYTIGCGQKVEELKAQSIAEARKEAAQIFEDHGSTHAGSDTELVAARIFEGGEDLMPLLEELIETG